MRSPFFSWLFLGSICTILLGVEVYVVSGQCLSDQRSLLLQLKKNLKFNSARSKKLVQWNEASDCCLWQGVICEEGRVTGLNLSNESITGGIDNSSLFNLQYLKSLDLSYNNINSMIPSRIGDLTNLSRLNFSNAGFEGQIPGGISNLTRLVALDLSIQPNLVPSSLKLENPNLSMLVKNLKQLEELYLDGLNITVRRNEWCQALSSSVLNLRVLSLSNCNLSGPVDKSLLKLKSLSVIRLDSNNLSASVPEFFVNFSNLVSLRLSTCRLNGVFPKGIFKVPTLQSLDISNNPSLHGSLPEFAKNSDLQRLVLGNTNFSGALPTSIGNLQNLSSLELANCSFDEKLPNSMTKLTQLVHLDLSMNKFTGPIPSFNMSSSLTYIDLSHNGLTGTVPSTHWEGLHKLVYLDLRYNSLNGSLPSSLFALPSLKKIQLSYNKFSGQVPDFKNVSSSILDTLDLNSNHLEGPVPRSIFKLKNLSILSLSSNKFNNTIELVMIKELGNLTTLDLSYNDLSVNVRENDSTLSSFPKISTLKLASCKLRRFPYLKNQSKLLYLDLSDNEIDGEIPNWIWNVGNGFLLHVNLSYNELVGMQEPYSLPNLSILDLHSNQLQGRIPVPPPSASYIDFSNNSFSSSIPNVIGNRLSGAIFFSLSKNSLTGVLPPSICNASYLQVLDLSNNRLSGRIPECLSTMTLGVLNLQRNNFSGSVPDAFQDNCALQTLAVNGNSIEGQIPSSLGNCKTLEVLDLGNNKMIGQFPCFLKNTSNLRVLVLRSNNFHGKIGCPNISGTWKMLQIVDLAFNNFNGNLPGQCLETWEAMMADENEFDHLRFEFFQYYPSQYYQDTVTVTFKGLQVELVKIITLFTSIDLSFNKLDGPMPKQLGQFRSLRVLNLSSNALTSQIPSSLANLRTLESLDLSNNKLNGEIPASLANLTFLSVLNFSNNQLVGRIPKGTQLQSFSADSFAGNEGLCGPPLAKECPANKSQDAETKVKSGVEFDWQFIYTGVGFGVGAGGIMALLLFWEEGRNWFDDSIDKILLVILPMMGFVYKTHDQWDDAEDDTDVEGSEFMDDYDEDDDPNEVKEFQGRYCVLCSKLDITKKRVIHDPKCTCHSSPTISSSSSSCSSSSSFS
ncbi:hypothetical protein FNV43_RR08777 [Rhamnella rubrinervis]|uniref:Leucine-rich repeat-containing N-terminal plant-type domain-containing protein n=1 Tax=Rhamnella rubrinervis TaxID=2594499 RepID=A0A8K0MJ43_9ROSA|nr:hypothetical protein FNV43_RR08777 [Rhamnella rubrinervis]